MGRLGDRLNCRKRKHTQQDVLSLLYPCKERTDFNKGQEEQMAKSTGLIPYPNSNHTWNFKRCLCKLCSKSNNDAIFCHLNECNYLNILREQ